ncbi:hypothetical protein SUGI_0967930 [Cryptomeria japonica]|nr:hypothetical protein SUGI_0967930 [Cryptomeria japonica]
MDNLKEDREDVKLLTYWFSPYGMRVMIGLEEKGISYEYVEDDLRPGNKSPMLLQMNPIHKKVPVLIHNGSPISESLIVLQYIDNVWNSPHNAFLPSHPYDRAIALFWTDFVDQKVCTPVNQIVKTKGEIQEAAKCDFLQNLAILEGELKGKKYFGGDRFGLVDIAFVPFTSWFDAVESLGRLKIDLEEKFPNIWAWKKRCLERESVKKTLLPPEKVLVVASELRKAKLVSGHFRSKCPLLNKKSNRVKTPSSGPSPFEPRAAPSEPPPFVPAHDPSPTPPPNLTFFPRRRLPLTHPTPPSSSAPSMANSILNYNNAIKEALSTAHPPPYNPFEFVDTPELHSGSRSQNAQQLVLEKLRRAAEARKVLEQDLHKQKLEIEASPWQIPDLEDMDRGALLIIDTMSRASNQGLELSACRGPTRFKTDEISTLEVEDGGPTVDKNLVNPLDASIGSEATRRDLASNTYCTSSAPIDALKAEQTATQEMGIIMDPFTLGNTNFEQGSTGTQEGFTMVKNMKARRKRSPKNSKDSASRKESLGPE